MSSTAWFQKKPKVKASDGAGEHFDPAAPSRMKGLWTKCDACEEFLLREALVANLFVCPRCQHHMPWPGRARLAALCDEGSFEEHDAGLEAVDALGFSDSKKYRDRLKATKRAVGERDAFVGGLARIGGHRASVGCFLFEFMGGSMGTVVGEKIARVFERATELRLPVVIFSASGGARMQEGTYSLMQMAKTSAAISRFRAVRKPYVSVLLNPTTGGVAASFSWLGDVVLAEPKALIGFAGPRVIEQTIRQKLPEGFQRSEYLLAHGMIDAIVPRSALRERLVQVLGLLAG